MTREELQSRTEEVIRSERQRRTRLQQDTLLDNQGRLYSDGRNVYLGIVIRNKIFPAVMSAGYKQPGCLFENRVIEGVYRADEDKVICHIKSGKTTQQAGREIAGKDINSGDADKESNKTKPQPTDKKKKTVKQPVKRKKTGSGRSPATAKPGQVVELNPFSSRQKFGIRAGTWARVFLPRAVSSSETADIELELIADVPGAQQTLPAGSIFFVRHRINPVTQRLDMDLSLMILPDGKEFAVVGTVHGLNREAGLAGAVISHSERVATLAIRSGILGTTKNELVKRSPDDPAASLAGDVAAEVLEANRQALPRIPSFSVEVSPGEAWVRFGRSF